MIPRGWVELDKAEIGVDDNSRSMLLAARAVLSFRSQCISCMNHVMMQIPAVPASFWLNLPRGRFAEEQHRPSCAAVPLCRSVGEREKGRGR